jgi:hypothetical protein
VVVKELVVLLLESGYITVEGSEDVTNTLKVVLFKGSELLDSSKEFDKLGDSSAEEVELSEDLVG